ncbi:MAG: hypothetical protein PHS41_01715 [Victivallaceae bacterium]|nr:hypothetical protein [Victivallaceae bacterium]
MVGKTLCMLSAALMAIGVAAEEGKAAGALYENMCGTAQSLALWKNSAVAELLPAAGPSGNYAVKFVASDDKGKTINFIIPVAAVRGKTVTFSAMVKAENVKAVPQSWKGVKCQIFAVADGNKQYNEEGLTRADRFGSYQWRKVSTTFAVPANLNYMGLSMGIYQTSGTVLFSNINFTVK